MSAAMRLEHHLTASNLPVTRYQSCDSDVQCDAARRERQIASVKGILDDYEPVFRELAKR